MDGAPRPAPTRKVPILPEYSIIEVLVWHTERG